MAVSSPLEHRDLRAHPGKDIMLIYATADDLTEWTTNAPDDVDPMLRMASGMVRHQTRAARYYVDPSGKPSDPDILRAMRDATCAQVAFWVAADIDPTSAGVGKTEKVVASKSRGDRSVTYLDLSASVTVAQARAEASVVLCGEAWLILADAGLTSGQPGV